MNLSQTVQKLTQITDEGFFERLATAVLREAKSEYSALVHSGINAEGKTVKAPLDGICFVPGAQPPHVIAAHHTISARDGLEKKWLHDPVTVKPRKNKRPTAPQGDLIKTAAIIAEERKRMPSLRATLILTTNQEPSEDLIRNVNVAGLNYGIDIDIWSRSRLAHFLDNNPQGQWLRYTFLGDEPELISPELLRKLSASSLKIHLPPSDPKSWIDRSLDHAITNRVQREIAFVVAGSGYGKTVACYKWLAAHVNAGGFGLILPSEIVKSNLTLERAIGAALCQLHPGLTTDVGTQVLSLCSPDCPLLFVVEDINRSDQSHLLAERIANWLPPIENSSNKQPPSWRLLCPLWPEVLISSASQIRGRIEELSLIGAPFSKLEGSNAVQCLARIKGKNLSALDADAISDALGHDPLLIALHDPAKIPEAHKVLTEFVETSLMRTAASHHEYTATDYRIALSMLSGNMLLQRQFDPVWNEISNWPGLSSDIVRRLSHLAHADEIIGLVGTSANQRIRFRHDRIRDWLLIDAIAVMMRAENLDDGILAEPYFAEVIGGALLQDSIPVVYAEKVLAVNPLALFHAFRIFQEPDTDMHHAILSAIDIWLDVFGIDSASHQYLKWEALTTLSQTESTKVCDIVRRFKSESWPAWQARFRNGDFIGGIRICIDVEPGVGAPWRDLQIDHAKVKFGNKLTLALCQILQTIALGSNERIGALRLAGYLADPILAEAIEACWQSDTEKEKHLEDYLWAAAECCADNPQRFLAPVCDAWAALSDESTKEHMRSPRDSLAATHIRRAFQKLVPSFAIPYFIIRAGNDDLRGPVTYMLHGLDHPMAIEFVVNEFAAVARRLEGSGNFSSFLATATDEWRRRNENATPMSAASRKMLLNLWQPANNDKHIRMQAFRLWSATQTDKDLEILCSMDLSDYLGDSILSQRLIRRDYDAIPALLEKIRTSGKGYWWQFGCYVWSNELTITLDDELKHRSTNVVCDWDQEWESDWITAELIIRLPIEAGEALLIKYWEYLKFSPYFIAAALYIATPRLCGYVKEVVAANPKPSELLKHLGIHFGIKISGHPGVTRKVQVEAVVPYLKLLSISDIHAFWEVCNDRGWYDLRRKHFDDKIPGMYGEQYLDDARAMKALDEMIKENRFYWVEHWIKGFLETGASVASIIALIAVWLNSRQTFDAWRLAALIVVQIGRRIDLTILNTNTNVSEDIKKDLITDAIFAVKRRTLH